MFLHRMRRMFQAGRSEAEGACAMLHRVSATETTPRSCAGLARSPTEAPASAASCSRRVEAVSNPEASTTTTSGAAPRGATEPDPEWLSNSCTLGLWTPELRLGEGPDRSTASAGHARDAEEATPESAPQPTPARSAASAAHSRSATESGSTNSARASNRGRRAWAAGHTRRPTHTLHAGLPTDEPGTDGPGTPSGTPSGPPAAQATRCTSRNSGGIQSRGGARRCGDASI